MFYCSVLLTLIALFSSMAQAQIQCRDLFSRLTLSENEKIESHLAHEFSYKDTASGFHFEATLYDDGFVFIDAFLRKKDGTRSAQRGDTLYKLMIEHFGVKNITGIEDSWFTGDNLKEFYTHLKKGMTREEAARHTWSGRQAAKYGFTYVRSVEPIREDLDYEFSAEIVTKSTQVPRAIKAVFIRPPAYED